MFQSTKSISRASAARRGQTVRRSRIDWERLDQRLVLSGTSTMMATVDPATLLQAVAVVPIQNSAAQASSWGGSANSPGFDVRFNQPLDATQINGFDFDVDQVNADGTTTRLSNRSISYTEMAEPADPTGKTLLVQFTSTLDPGQYQLVLDGNNSLMDQAGHGTSPIDQMINEFAVGTVPASAPTTQLVGSVAGPVTTLTFPVITDNLSHTRNELDLPTGFGWSIAPQFGTDDPSDYRVALYNSNQQLMLTTSGADLAYLNDNLASGRYFLQFYQTQTQATAANPTIAVTVTGNPALTLTIPSTGSGNLGTTSDQSARVAIPQVLSITTTNYNGLPGNPDSVLVHFDRGNLDPALLNSATSAFHLTDASGQVWPVTPSAFSSATNRLLLVFGSNLPTGQYTLAATLPAAASGGSTPTTQNLGSFTTVLSTLPGNLGTVYPASTAMSWQNMTMVDSGASVTERFSIIAGDTYRVNLSNPNVSGQLIQLSSSNSNTPVNRQISTNMEANLVLEPGIYELLVTNKTRTAQEISFCAIATEVLDESLSNSGVGQLPAGLGQTNLIGSASLAGTAQNLALVTNPTASTLANPASASNSSSPGAGASSTSRGENSGSFNVASFGQIPIGAISNGASMLKFESADLPTSVARALVGSLNSTFMINTGQSAQFPLDSKPSAQPRPHGVVPVPRAFDPADVTWDAATPASGEVAIPPRVSFASEEAVIRVTADQIALVAPDELMEETADLMATDPTALICELSQVRAHGLTSTVTPIHLGYLSSPIGLLVASCVINRRIRAARSESRVANQDHLASIWHSGLTKLGRRKLPHRD